MDENLNVINEQNELIEEAANNMRFNRKQAIVGGLIAIGIGALGFTGGYLYGKAKYKQEVVESPLPEIPEELL
jgi:hypothetical protein